MDGLGVMLARLGGNRESAERFASAIGKTIARVELKGDALRFEMADGSRFGLEDTGQSCCESRYMTCEDKLESFEGAELMGAEVRDAPSRDGGYGDHDVQFLIVTTSKGVLTAETHNEHNGYYGGFAVACVP